MFLFLWEEWRRKRGYGKRDENSILLLETRRKNDQTWVSEWVEKYFFAAAACCWCKESESKWMMKEHFVKLMEVKMAKLKEGKKERMIEQLEYLLILLEWQDYILHALSLIFWSLCSRRSLTSHCHQSLTRVPRQIRSTSEIYRKEYKDDI